MTRRNPPQLSLFEGLALLVGEPARKRRERQQPQETEDECCARVVREETRAALAGPLLGVAEHELPPDECMLGHGPAYICPACADCGDTDACGFLHRQVCKGRIPLRACKGCGKLATHGRWNHADFLHCIDCMPLGSPGELMPGRQCVLERQKKKTTR